MHPAIDIRNVLHIYAILEVKQIAMWWLTIFWLIFFNPLSSSFFFRFRWVLIVPLAHISHYQNIFFAYTICPPFTMVIIAMCIIDWCECICYAYPHYLVSVSAENVARWIFKGNSGDAQESLFSPWGCCQKYLYCCCLLCW